MILGETVRAGKLKKVSILVRNWILYRKNTPDRRTWSTDFRAWMSTTFFRRNIFDAGIPWINFQAARILADWLKPEMEVFEWGCGASTLFLAQRTHSVTSVEHDLLWFETMQQKIKELALNQVTLLHCPPQSADIPIPMEKGENPEDYFSEDPGFKGSSFYNYVHTIHSYPECSFDLVIVDGRARPGCLRAARSKVKIGGLLLLDNSERQEYRPEIDLFMAPEWRTVHIVGPGPASLWPAFSQTTFFYKVPVNK